MPQALPFIGAAASVAGAVGGKDASEDAANAQVGASDRSVQLQREMFNQTQANLSPYMRSGGYALQDLEYLLGTGMGRGDYISADPSKFGILSRPFSHTDFQASPGYQFNLQQGLDAINKQARKSGKAYAPATLQDVARYSQGLASNEWNNERNAFRNFQNDMFNRISGASGSGQNAAANLGGFAGQAGNAISNAIMGGGNAQAAGIVGGANALSSGLSNAYNSVLTGQMLRQAQTPTYTGPGYTPPTGTDWQMEP